MDIRPHPTPATLKESSLAPARYRWIWAVPAVAWLLWGTISMVRLAGSPYLSWNQAFWYGFPDAVIWALLTPWLIGIAHRRPVLGPRPWRSVGFHLFTAPAFALLHAALDTGFAAARSLISGSDRLEMWPVFLKILYFGFHTNVLIYILVVCLVQYLDRDRRALEGEQRAKHLEAQLQAVRTSLGEGAQEPPPKPEIEPRPTHLSIPKGRSRITLCLDDVLWIGAESNYVRFHLEGKSHLARRSLRSLESELDPNRFVRVHRSSMVNVAAIERLEGVGRGDYRVYLKNGDTVAMSRRYRPRFEEVVKSF